jgi:arylsulfatase A-like enzyme
LRPVSVNVLFVTLDQFRGDCLSCAGHPLVRTPHLDALAADGVRLARHYSQAAPCAPGRASLYTGTYQMNHRVVANGTPLDVRFDNLALAARRAGYVPTLFGYTDQAADPRTLVDPADPRLSRYSGILPGFDVEVDLPDEHEPWLAWLAERGYDVSGGAARLLASEADRPAEHSVSAFLTDRAIEWLHRQDRPWFAHLSYLRPHPPYAAAGHWAAAYDPDAVPAAVAPAVDRHPFHDEALRIAAAAAPTDDAALRRLRAQYYGMVSEVDDQLGRLLAAIRALGMWDDTIVVVTSDHGEMLGDHGLVQKLGYWEQSYHVVGIVRDPRRPSTRGSVVERFTENVDVLPTICEMLGEPVPAQCDGLPLTALLDGADPPWWRTAAHWEYDWRDIAIRRDEHPWPWDRTLEQLHLAVRRDESTMYVQFGDGSWRCFDLAADPTGRTTITDPAIVLPLAQAMLVWRSRHADRTLTDMLTEDGGIGRLPPGSPAPG